MREQRIRDISASVEIPEPGQLVRVRERRYVVVSVSPSEIRPPTPEFTNRAPSNFVQLSSIDDEGLGERLDVVWELEPGAQVIERNALPDPVGFDDPGRYDAFLNAVRWGAISSADPTTLQAPFRSGIEIEDYQLDPLVRALRMPRANLLIADDVGLGKTIEAGLVIQELLLRNRARTVLIICPSSLQLQWRDQMRDKFGLEFRVVDAETVKELRRTRGIHSNAWGHFPRLIASIDYVKRDAPLRRLRERLPGDGTPTYPRTFDLLIVDEAHNLAPASMGRYAVDSRRTQTLRLLAPHFEHKLFLSATPHNGYRESFTALLELLDDQRFARGVDPDPMQLSAIMVRRLKSELKRKWDGSPRFAERRVIHIPVAWTDAERRVHRTLQRYTELRHANATGQTEMFAAEFVLKLLKKRLFSSPSAFAVTLTRHVETVSGKGTRAAQTELRHLRRQFDAVDEDFGNDGDYEVATNDAVMTASASFTPLTDEERGLLKDLQQFAEREAERADTKAASFLDWLARIVRPGGAWAKERVIIFTEYRATQNYLMAMLASCGLAGPERVALLYGGMPGDDREAIKAAFQASPDLSELRILLATDAASEGIDLQNHCHRLVHYEIPWNPNRLEQRNGRVDRHGQRAPEVLIHHFVSAGFERGVDSDRPPGDLDGDLEFLMRAALKVEQIREDLGKVGPVIARQVEEAMLGRRRRLDTAQAERDAEAPKRLLRFERDLQKSIAGFAQQLRDSIRTLNLTPTEVANVVRVGLELAGQPQLIPLRIDGVMAPCFRLPLFRGAWAAARVGIEHPHTKEERPILFDGTAAAGRDDVVLAHLNHRLVQMCLQLLRAEVWKVGSAQKLYRVTTRRVPGRTLDAPCVLAHGRLVVLGGDRYRLREDIIVAGGRIDEGARLRRLTLEELTRLSEAPTVDGASETTRSSFAHDVWPRIREPLWRLLEARKTEITRSIEDRMTAMADDEVTRMKSILGSLKQQIEEELARTGPIQLDLFDEPERDQYRRDRDALRRRAERIPAEMEQEEVALRERYANPTPYLFPVGVTFLIPDHLDR